MATLTFLKLDRVIQVDSPQTTVTIQDLINQIRDYEDELINMDYDKIANAFGKQDLGGGAKVGITLELVNDWRLAFEARSGPDTVLCTVSGGNLVAVNQYNNNPIKPTAFTQVVIAQSSSPTIIKAESDTTLLHLIERIIGANSGSGSYYYWDPINGSDTNDGTTPGKAVATFTQAHSLAQDGKYDTIIAISSGIDGITTVTEPLTITKDCLKVRGPGYTFQIKPTTTTTDTITINAGNVELSGFYVSTAATGSRSAILVNGHHNTIKDCWVTNVRGHGIAIANSARTRINTCVIEKCGLSGTGNGINIGNNVTQSLTSKCIISENVTGILLSGSGIADNIFENNLIYNNTGYGIDVGIGVLRTGVRLHHTFSGNSTAATRDNGTGTFIEAPAGGASASEIADAVWDEVISGHLTLGTTGRALKDAKTKATLASLK